MLDLIKKALGSGGPSAVGRKTRVELVASVLLLEAAHSDYECSPDEMQHAAETVRRMFDLPHEYMDELMELARCERAEAVDIQQFTRVANKEMGREEKLAVLEAVWRIVLVDGRIDKHEEYYARKLTHLLRLEHKDFIDAKLRAQTG